MRQAVLTGKNKTYKVLQMFLSLNMDMEHMYRTHTHTYTHTYTHKHAHTKHRDRQIDTLFTGYNRFSDVTIHPLFVKFHI